MRFTSEDLHAAIEDELIEPAFQPLIHLGREVCIGFEVLARWTHPKLGSVSPLTFISLAESAGLIKRLTRQVIVKACTRAIGFSGEPVLAFNLSPIQFRESDLFDEIAQTIRSTSFPLHRVHIEMTESALIEDQELALSTIAKFQDAGMGVALDDFGTGFASLTRLHSFPFNKLKIDASFVGQMVDDETSRKIVASVVGLGQSLGMIVVAEGVETREQLNILKRLGCDVGQGYLFGKPTAAKEIIQFFPYPYGPMPKRTTSISPLQKLHQLEALYNGAPIALAFIDTRARYVSANERFCKLVGRTWQNLVGSFATRSFSVDRRKTVEKLITRILRGRSIKEKEITEVSSGKTYVVSCSFVADDLGKPIGLSVSLVDVTRRKSAETKLKADEEYFRRSVKLSPRIFWEASASGEVFYMSPTLGGGTNVAMEDRISNWYDRMHPDDRPTVREQWLRWLPTARRFKVEFRIWWSDGTWRWMKSEAAPSLNSAGHVERWNGVITDSDEVKKP